MIGIDVGGANLKVVDAAGVHIHYCPLWQESPIAELLSPYAGEPAAVVMSGELADCFMNKAEGIAFIVSQVQKVFPSAIFYGTDGTFHRGPVSELAAANWLVMADELRSRYPDALLVDMGSTTTDIIPLNAFDRMLGQTDLSRLQQGYMVYCGLLRTNVATLIRSSIVNGIRTPVSTEYFASTGDAYVALGLIDKELFTAETADKKGVDPELCLRRLARVVCADLEEISLSGAHDIAWSVIAAERELVTHAVNDAKTRHGCDTILVAGIGSSIVSGWFDGIDLGKEMGAYAHALPAWAVREVAIRTGNSSI